ncbi:MAG: biotin-dependent carboxyltransferase family protein [Verrucomicrobia subdivision 3 bacterium]|nr:biotin-dependent carboxyltransferase family protein [Limisphaerales bacterium]
MAAAPICEVVATGFGITVQDQGRPGWRRFGVPASGAMDDHAALWANRLLGNPPDAPVLELLGGGARLRFLRETWLAVTGADLGSDTPRWRAAPVKAEHEIHFASPRSGLWGYIAVAGGFACPKWLGSASVYARGQFGTALKSGDTLSGPPDAALTLPAGVSGRLVPWTEQRDYDHPPLLRVWPGPQWDQFHASERDRFFAQPWTVTAQSDRVGYRLAGDPLKHTIQEMISEPLLPGTIQVPPDGQPIVTMRDGPTVGGYAKLGLLDPADISWLAQVRPGRSVRFKLAHAA